MNNFKPGGPGPIPAQMKVDLSSIKNMKCACKNEIFLTVANLKFISPFYTGTGQPAGARVEMLACMNCGLLFPAVIEQAEVEKFAANPGSPRLNLEGLVARLVSKVITGAKIPDKAAAKGEG